MEYPMSTSKYCMVLASNKLMLSYLAYGYRAGLGIVTFDDSGAVTGCALISAAGSQVAATISHGVYHTALALDSGSIFFEAKGGPYLPLTEEELGGFAPQENSPECALYLERARALFQ